MVAVLAAILGFTTASASATVGAETRVGALNVAGEVLVGPPEHVAAGQRLGDSAAEPDIAVATGVAAKTETSLVKYEEWPANNGFFGGFEKDSMLQPGTRIDRYGSNRGSFVSPEGTPFKNRGLPSSRAGDPYSSFTVQKPITVRGGIAAPWMDSPGGGPPMMRGGS